MSVFRTNLLESLHNFKNRNDQLGIVERNVPLGAKTFFQNLMKKKFTIFESIRKQSLENDIQQILERNLPDKILLDPFYKFWHADMVKVTKVFCEILGTKTIAFWLGTKRGCSRFHQDNVQLRLLVTYAGKGTEWIPNTAINRNTFVEKKPKNIINYSSNLKYLNKWDVAVFRGMPNGLLHRTPNEALKNPSILMRLDNLSFFEDVLKSQEKMS